MQYIRKILPAVAMAAFVASCAHGPTTQLLKSVPYQSLNADLYWSDGYPRATVGPWATATSQCRLRAVAKVSILSAPANGRARIQDGDGHWAYGADNEFSKCNGLPVRGPFVIYRPDFGFRGEDKLSFRVRFVNGEVRIVQVNLHVH